MNARLYVTVFLLLGMCVLMMAFADWQLPDPIKFASFFLLAITASVLKVSVPAMAGRMPFNFLFVLVGLIELTFPETLLIGCASVVIECVWRRESPASLLETYFSVANMAVAIAVANRLVMILANHPGVPEWMVIGLATVVFFVFNTFPVAAVVSLSGRSPVLKVWRQSHFGQVGCYMAGGALAWGFHKMSAIAGWQTTLLTLPVVYLLYRTYRLYVARIEDEKVHAEELANLHMRTIEALALAIEAKDTTTSDHLKRVQVYAVEIGRELGMTEEDLDALRAAAVLHDIGKLAVPEYIISKPGRLTPEEFEKMKVHPVVGAEILEHVQFPYPVVPTVRAHHEKWNGTGYPEGLRGEEIPLGARILSAVDALDALATDRQYRRALPLADAMRKVEEEASRSFDPRVVEVLKRRYVELERKAQEVKGTGLKLSTDVKIGNGAAPAAGFEKSVSVPFFEKKIEDIDLLEQVAQVRNDIQSLFETGVDSSAMDLDEICSVFALRLQRILPFEAIAIYLIREDSLAPAYVHGDNHRLFSSLRIPMGQGLSGWVAENAKPIVNGNPSVESGYMNNPSVFSTLRSALALPMLGADGIIGVISLYRDARDGFTREHLRLMESTVSRLALAIEAALHRAPAEGRPKSSGIALDGAGLLRHLEAELARSKRLNSPLALLLCSVEGMQRVPEQEADFALRTVLHGLEHGGRDFNAVARTGDREFALVVPGLTEHGMRAKVARLAQLSFSVPAVWVAVGEAMYPTDGVDAEQLLALADRRLFRFRAERTAALEVDEERIRSGAWLQ